MAVHGSIEGMLERHIIGVQAAMEETAHESLDKMQEMVKDRTPGAGSKYGTGALQESITQTPPVKADSKIMGAVLTDVEYAQWVEYGAMPHSIFPNDARVLRFHDGTFAAYVLHHPGMQGYHMFRDTAIEFRRRDAGLIASKNLMKHLG